MSKTISKNYRNCAYVYDYRKPKSLREIRQTTNAIEELNEFGFYNRSRDLKRTKLPNGRDDVYISSNRTVPQRGIFTLTLNSCKETVGYYLHGIKSIEVYRVNLQGALQLDSVIIDDFLTELSKLNSDFVFRIIYDL